MTKTKTHKKDKLLSTPSSTGSSGLSTSSNITAEAAGSVGDNSTSLFPDVDEEKKWSARTTTVIHDNK